MWHQMTKGGENPTFFRPMHWVFCFNAKNLSFANKTMVLFQLSALGIQHHHWRTLTPLPYTLNLCAIKRNKTKFCWTSYDCCFFLKTMKNPPVKNLVVATLQITSIPWKDHPKPYDDVFMAYLLCSSNQINKPRLA